jgi:hypothetical protein
VWSASPEGETRLGQDLCYCFRPKDLLVISLILLFVNLAPSLNPNSKLYPVCYKGIYIDIFS